MSNFIDSSDSNTDTSNSEQNSFEEVCIVTTGSVDSGKSTLIGALTTNELDDGNGKLRALIAKHKHELISGKTSDISIRTIQQNNKEIVMVDLCGHKKYLGTTIFGLTGYFPDYGALIISANRGVLAMTKEHMGLLLCLNIPFIIIVTREDIAPLSIYDKTISMIQKILKKYNKNVNVINTCLKTLLKNKYDYIKTYISEHYLEYEHDLLFHFQTLYDNDFSLDMNSLNENIKSIFTKIFTSIATTYEQEKYSQVISISNSMKNNPFIVPVVTISNKTGFCLNLAKQLIYNLSPRKDHWDPNEDSAYYIDCSYEKPGIGIIVSGVLRGKKLTVGDTVFIGPYGSRFIKIKIWSMHNNNKQAINHITNAHRGCFAIRVLEKKLEFKRNDIRKGMVIVSTLQSLDNLCYEFNADIDILHHSTTIKTGFSPSIQLTNSKQAARIVIVNKNNNSNEINETDEQIFLRTGDKAQVKFRFLYKPEFVRAGDEFIFKEETTRGKGVVTSVLSIANDTKGPIGKNRVRSSTKSYKLAIKKGSLQHK